ncbi:MAG: hypothetical protein DMF62_06260 [Acidobacteria bacterium]|nr:MAG: hypothetical protein DMF62_06260 [Acidobacteriota bacterium]
MRILKSILAVLAGLIFIIFSHSLTDFILESFGIFPPPSEGLHVTWMLLLALGYRTVLSIVGCFITAKLAPQNAMKHAVILGFIGVFLSTVGAVIGIQMNLSDTWYPIALILVSLPCAWIGGRLASSNAKIA